MNCSRRSFIGKTAALAGLSFLPSAGFSANDRLRIAVFGNMYNAEHFLTAIHSYNAELVALCNPDQRKIPAIVKRWNDFAAKTKDERVAAQYRRMAKQEGVRVYADVRRMFAEMADQIDAFVLSDYDHFHGVACGEAMRAGKPVCSERPIGLTIDDARRLRALASETKVPTTYRSPGTGTGQFRRAIELVDDGVIGEVNEAHVWFKRTNPDRTSPPRGEQDIPEGLEWDLWLGPLPSRDYHGDWMAYGHWRETSNGGLGVFGMHTTIFPFMALKMRELWDAPGKTIGVYAECSGLNRLGFPRWERVRWDIPARKNMPPLSVTWHHGPDFAPGSREFLRAKFRLFGVSEAEEADTLLKEAGSMIIGRKGALVGDDHSVRITGLPRPMFKKIQMDRPKRIPDSRGIYRDWIDACRGGEPHIIADFENGSRLSELIMIGNIATQFPKETLAYNPSAGRFTKHDEANQKLGFKYRDGWRI